MRIYPHPTHAGWYVVDIPPRKDRKRERLVFKTYDAATRYAKVVDHVKPETVVHPKIGEVVDAYLLWVKDNQSEETYYNKEIRFRKHITPFFAPYRVKDINQLLLDRYAATMKKSCYLTDLSTLMALIGWMAKRKYADKLPFEPEWPKTERKIKLIPDPADILKFCDAIPVETHRIMALFMMFSAARTKEIRQLKWENYNGNAFVCEHTKTKDPYLQPIPDCIAAWFEDNKKESGYVFQSRYKPNQPVSDIYNSLKIAAKISGIKMTPHLFRHAAATFTYDQTEDIYAVQQLLRHSKVQQSTIYTRFSAARRQKTMNTLAAYINESAKLSNVTIDTPAQDQ